MAQQTPSEMVRQASTWSIIWGVSLIVFGVLAVGSPLLAAVAVNAFLAWLIVLAGVVHLIIAFHAHSGLEAAGRACLYVFRRVPDHASGNRCGVAHASARIVVPGRRRLGYRSVLQDAPAGRIELGAAGWDRYPAAGADDLSAMAVEFGLGNRHLGGREHDHQRRDAGHAVVERAQGRRCDIAVVNGGLGIAAGICRGTASRWGEDSSFEESYAQ